MILLNFVSLSSLLNNDYDSLETTVSELGSSSIDTSEYGLKTYTNPTDLGCTAASTVYEIFTALPSGAQFMYDASSLTDESWNFPTTYGSVFVAKPVNASRGYIYLYTKESVADYRAYTCNGTEDDLASLTWFQNIQNDASHGSGLATGGTATPIYVTTSGHAAPISATVGSGVIPTYLNSGTITASTSTVGAAAKPIYMSSGTLTAMSGTVGGTAKPIYMSSGTLSACSSTVGSSNIPVYMSSGTITTTGVDLSKKVNTTYSNTSSAITFYLDPDDTSTYATFRMSGSGPYAVSLVYTANGSNTIYSLMDSSGNFMPSLKSARFSDFTLDFTIDSTTGVASYSGKPSTSITSWTGVQIIGVNTSTYPNGFCTGVGRTSFSNSSGTVSISGFLVYKVDNGVSVGSTVTSLVGITLPIKVRLFY